MSASQALQRLYSLDTSSSEFLRALYKFTRLDENGECSFNLRQAESGRLVDFLDGVGITKSLCNLFRLRLTLYPYIGARFYSRDGRFVPTLSSSTAPSLQPSRNFTFITHNICWAEENRGIPRCVWRIRRCVGGNAWKRKSVYQSTEGLQCENE